MRSFHIIGSLLLKAAVALLICLALSQRAFAFPTFPTVVAGSAMFQFNDPTLTITFISPVVVINWNSFSLAADETIKFVSPEGSAVLNRVIGGAPSILSGSISSNSNFLLIDLQGIAIAGGAIFSNGDLALSTLNVSNQNFLLHSDEFQSLAYQWPGVGGQIAINGTIDVGDQALYLTSATITVGNDALLLAGTITLDTVPTAVSEPSTWGMLVVGISMLGVFARRRRK